jgi:hypothetical protein
MMNKREKDKKNKEMNAKNALEGIEGNVGDVSNNIGQVMAANTQESQEHNNNTYELCVDSKDIAKQGEIIMSNIDIENYKEQDRWDYSNKYNKWHGGGVRNNDEPKHKRILENNVCNDRIRNDEVANILLSFNRITNWKIHVMMKRRKIVRERIRVTNMTNLKLM